MALPAPRSPLGLALALALGCDVDHHGEGEGEGEAETGDLGEAADIVDPEAWAPVPLERDPLAAHRPGAVDCPAAAWGVEHGQLEVQTGVCNYLALDQPSLAPLLAGQTLALDLWHADLDAAEPASGHFALLVDGAVVDEVEVSIPSQAALYRLSWTAPAPVPAGATVAVHLHNHGFNAWTVAWVGTL